MLIDGRYINYGRRADGGPKPFDPNNMKMQLTFHKESGMFTIRVEDNANPEFWLQILISESELAKAKMEGI